MLRGVYGGKVWGGAAGRRRVGAAGRKGAVGAWNGLDIMQMLLDEDDDDEEVSYTRLKLPDHGPATAVGQAVLDGETLVTADGMGTGVVAEVREAGAKGNERSDSLVCDGLGRPTE